MAERYAISDAAWERVAGLLPGKAGDGGPVADNRRFLDAVVYVARAGLPWRDLPGRFGHWNSVFRRFSRWAAKGVWLRTFEALQEPDLEALVLDSTTVRASPDASGAARPPAGPAAHPDDPRDQKKSPQPPRPARPSSAWA